MDKTMQNIGGALPSGIPRNIARDANGVPVSLGYWQLSEGKLAQPLSEYHEEFVSPSGVVYGADGRVTSYGVENVGQFTDYAFYLDVTDMVREDTDETLDVVIETSYTQGDSWSRVAQFNTVSTAGASTQVMFVSPSGTSALIVDGNSTDPGPGKVLTAFLGDRVRAAATFTDAANTDSSGVFSVYGIFKN